MESDDDGFIAMEPLSADKRSELDKEYQDLMDNQAFGGYPVKLLHLQVNDSRATLLLSKLRKAAQTSTEEARQLVSDLLNLAKYAYATVRNPSSSAIWTEETNLLSRVETFITEELQTDPLPASALQVGTPSKSTSAETAKDLCRMRDSMGRGTLSNSPLCPFTDLPLAQAAHIIPINTAGLAESRIWFWMWMAVVLPKENYQQLWKECAGTANNSLRNLILLGTPLYSLWDKFAVSLKPVANTAASPSCKLTLESLCTEEAFKLEGLRHANGVRFDDDPNLNWSASSAIPVDEQEKFAAPSALLFAVRHYFAQMPRVIDRLQVMPPPPAPHPEMCKELLGRWAEARGRLRTPSRTPSHQATPQSKSASPGFSKWTPGSVSKQTSSKKRGRDEDEEEGTRSSPLASSSSPTKKRKGSRPRGGYASPTGYVGDDGSNDDEDDGDGEVELAEEEEEEHSDSDSWRWKPGLTFPQRCEGYTGPGYTSWKVPMGGKRA